MRRLVAGAAAGWALALASLSLAASQKEVAAGKHHLQKANAQAAAGKCDSAVHEYTIAYEKLHDPVVLFNRAECYRRLGQNDAAVSDYRAFLEAVPRAPNRAEIEERLAALQGLPPPLAPPPLVRSPPPPVRPAAAAAPAPPARAAAPPPRPAQAAAPPPPPPAPVNPVLAPAPAAAPAPPAASEPVTPAAPVVVAPTPPPQVQWDSHGPWWLWTVVGVAVAGGAAGAYFASRSPGASPPATQLGNYKF